MKIFIAGIHGTVGSRLAASLDSTVYTITDDVKAADVIVLCVPDEHAESMYYRFSYVNPAARVIDASARFRSDSRWAYGLVPEDVQFATRVANPGCIATAAILMSKPLSDSGLLPSSVSYYASVGHSAAGKRAPTKINSGEYPGITQFGKEHRHLPEINKYANVNSSLTVFVGNWERGIVVSTTIPESSSCTSESVMSTLSESYKDNPFVQAGTSSMISPSECNFTNKAKIYVGQQGTTIQLACVLDNLGKGSVGNIIDILNVWSRS